MSRTQSDDPRDRMGVYKQLSAVPQHRRLARYADTYAESDTYDRFLTEDVFEQYDTERTEEKYQLAGRRWKTHLTERGRHHALARPADVDSWMGELLGRVSLNTAYNTYWIKIERFYTWLQRHPNHPHVYHPVLMAAANHQHASTVWDRKLQRGRDA